MRHIIVCLLCLTFCNIESLSFGHSREPTESPHPNPAPAQSYRLDSTLWTEDLDTFKERLPADPTAARSELQNVAKKLFGGHSLTDEWVPLYFRLNREGTEHLSDLIRVSELEIRMLTHINAREFARQIQHHRKMLHHYDKLEKISEGAETTLETREQDEQKEPSKTEAILDAKTGQEHLHAFHELLQTDPKAARAELASFSALAFHGHPLTKEWEELFFRLSREKEGMIPEIIRFLELKKQMLKDHSPEKHAKEIENLETAIEDIKPLAEFLERQGTLNTQKTRFTFHSASPE